MILNVVFGGGPVAIFKSLAVVLVLADISFDFGSQFSLDRLLVIQLYLFACVLSALVWAFPSFVYVPSIYGYSFFDCRGYPTKASPP